MTPPRTSDVVIVGSGAGGGTVAQRLAPLTQAGRRVLVLEQGPRFGNDEFTGRELEMAGALYHDGGGFLSADGTMTLAFAHGYGGSTIVYTGTSLTAPARVVERWAVPGLDHADLLRRSQRYLGENNVHPLPAEELNDNNRLFEAGARKAGYVVEQFPVNVKGCLGSSLCNLGCPNQAKQGTHRVQLPAAERAGVEVVTRAEVLRIAPDRSLTVRVGERVVVRPMAFSALQAVARGDRDLAEHLLEHIPAEALLSDAELHRKIGVREVYVGYDYAFGKGREGSIESLKRMGQAHGFAVGVVDAVRPSAVFTVSCTV